MGAAEMMDSGVDLVAPRFTIAFDGTLDSQQCDLLCRM